MKRKPIENDSKPEELVDKLIERNHSIFNAHPEVLILPSGERLHYRKLELVLWYHVFMFYPFRDECKLKVGESP